MDKKRTISEVGEENTRSIMSQVESTNSTPAKLDILGNSIRNYLLNGIPPGEEANFIQESFMFVQIIGFRQVPEKYTRFIKMIQNVLNNDSDVLYACRNNSQLENQRLAFNRMLSNNLHIYGGKKTRRHKRRRSKKSRKMRRISKKLN
jgi:hypothetical protein